MATLPSSRFGPGALGPYIRVTDISADVDDFMAAGWQDCKEVHLSATLPVVITGFYAVPGYYTLVRVLLNVGTENITLSAEDPASAVENQLKGEDVVLLPNTSVILLYDYTLLGWRAIGAPGAGAAGVQTSRVIGFNFQNSGIVLDAGTQTTPIYIPFDGEIVASFLFSSDPLGSPVIGSIVVDVYKGNYAGYPPASSITASAKPTITTGIKSTDVTLTGWTTTVTTGDIFVAEIASVTDITGATLILIVDPT